MKRAVVLLLMAVLCLSFCACGSSKELEKYKRYDALIGYIEAGDEENATNELLVLLQENMPEVNEPTITTVEITMDNWQEYFEIRVCESKYYNAFGELDDTWRTDAIYLKEEYISSLTTGGADVAFGVTATIAYLEYDEENNIFVENGTVCESLNYEVESVLSTWDLRSQSNIDTYTSDENGQVIAKEYYVDTFVEEKCYRSVFTGINVTRVTGTLEFCK